MGNIKKARANPIHEAKRLASLPRGERHWKYNPNPGVLTMHRRIHRRHGAASNYKCVDCGGRARDWSLNGDTYTDNVGDYSPRCRSCHTKYDDSSTRRENISRSLKSAWLSGKRKATLVEIGGQIMTLKGASQFVGIGYGTVWSRVNKQGKSVEEALEL